MPDDRLTRVTSICVALREVTREVHGQHVGFLVRKKHFAYYLDDHHGDGIVSINCRVLPHDNRRLVATDPGRFYMPAYIGARGWIGLRLDRGEVDWDEITELLTHSYLMTAPKRLSKLVAQSAG